MPKPLDRNLVLVGDALAATANGPGAAIRDAVGGAVGAWGWFPVPGEGGA